MFSLDHFIKLLFLFIFLLLLREYFTFKGKLPLKYIFTPLVTFSITGFVLLSMNNYGIDSFKVLVLISIIFSLIADTLLMIEEVDLMKYGIVFFLLAHIFYIIAFSAGYSFRIWNIIVAVIIVFVVKKAFTLFKSNAGSLVVPIFIYMIVISTMVFLAVSRLNHGFNRPALLAVSGSILFMTSDLILAYNAFYKKISQSSVIVWAVYAPAQLLIALSCF